MLNAGRLARNAGLDQNAEQRRPRGQVDALLGGLLRAKGRSIDDSSVPQVRFESALALGDVWALDQLWRELGFDGLAAAPATPPRLSLRFG